MKIPRTIAEVESGDVAGAVHVARILFDERQLTPEAFAVLMISMETRELADKFLEECEKQKIQPNLEGPPGL